MMAIQYIVFLQSVVLFAIVEIIDIIACESIYDFLKRYNRYSTFYIIVLGILLIAFNLFKYNKYYINKIEKRYQDHWLNDKIKLWMIFCLIPAIFLATVFVLTTTNSYKTDY
jgi:hypothetical protein